MTDTIHTTESRPAKKPISLIGMAPATDIESYDSVPFYRKTWFALFPLFVPALILTVLTGNIYASANRTMQGYSDAEVWRYTTASRVFFVVAAIFVIAFWSSVIFG